MSLSQKCTLKRHVILLTIKDVKAEKRETVMLSQRSSKNSFADSHVTPLNILDDMLEFLSYVSNKNVTILLFDRFHPKRLVI